MSNPQSEGGNGQLKALVERILRVKEEIKGMNADLSDNYKEVKSAGFDARIVKKIVVDLEKDPNKLREERELYDLYAAAVGFDP